MRKPRPPPILALDHVEQLRQKVAEVRASRSRAEKERAHTAVSTLHRQESELLRELHRLTAPAGEPARTVSDDEALAELLAAVGGLPEAALDALADAITARRTGKPVMRIVR